MAVRCANHYTKQAVHNHYNDCYFCLCKISVFDKTKVGIIYPNLTSAMRLVPHGRRVPIPTPPTVLLKSCTDSSKYYMHIQTAIARGPGLPASGPLYSRSFQMLTLLFQFIFPVDGYAETLAFTDCDYCYTVC